MVRVNCVNCSEGKTKEQAISEGWLVVPKINKPPTLFVICADCLDLNNPTATLDVMHDAPFREAARETQRKRMVQ